MSTLKKFAGQTAIYGLSTIVGRLINYILTPIFTGVYHPKIYGIFTTMYSWASIINPILAFGMETTFFRYLNKHDDKQKVYNTTFYTIFFLSALFLGAILLFREPLAYWMHNGSHVSVHDYKVFINLFAAILITDALAVIPFAKVRADGRPFRYSLIKMLNIISLVSFNLFFLFAVPWLIKNNYFPSSFGWFRPKWVGYVFISNLISSALTIVLLLPEVLKLTLRYDKKLFFDMLLYSFPVLIANLSFIVNETSDKIFLGRILGGDLGDQEVGIYGAVSKLSIFLMVFINAFRLGAEPFFFNHAKNKNSGETYSTIMDYFVIAVTLIFVGVVANIEILKYFITRESFWVGLKVVPILLFGYVSLGIYMNLSIWYKLSDQTRYGLYISGIGAVLTVILNIIFIPRYSYLASAWVSLTAYTTMMVISYIWGQKNYPIPYNLKKNLAYICGSVVLVVFSFVIFDRNLIVGNLLFFAFIAITLYLEKNNLKKIFSK